MKRTSRIKSAPVKAAPAKDKKRQVKAPPNPKVQTAASWKRELMAKQNAKRKG